MQSGSLYHIISRANNQEFLLENHHIKAKYLSLLRLAKLKFDFSLLAYCIMDNHVHMLIKMNSDPISKVMQWVNLKFASCVNITLDRNGHFFGARYHSTLIEDHFGVQKVIKYIHRNPIAAKMTNSLNYPWSSHNVYLGHPEASWFDACEGLETFQFGDSNTKFNYLRFVDEPDDLERLIDNEVMSEKEVHHYENKQVPGLHEYVLTLPEIEALSNVEGQLDLLFGRLCLMAKVDQYRISELVNNKAAKIPAIRRFKKAVLALMVLSLEFNIAKSDVVIAYLKLPQDFLIIENQKDVLKIDFEVKGIIDVYRQTFPQRNES